MCSPQASTVFTGNFSRRVRAPRTAPKSSLCVVRAGAGTGAGLHSLAATDPTQLPAIKQAAGQGVHRVYADAPAFPRKRPAQLRAAPSSLDGPRSTYYVTASP